MNSLLDPDSPYVTISPVQIRSHLAAVQDHSRQFDDFAFVYPVISRRSRGLSIGVNLNPDKNCNFDCIYCSVDRTTPGRVSKVDLELIRDELAAMIHFARNGGLAKEPKFNEVPWLTRTIKDIAFSGDGEPTSVRNFSDCVRTVAEMKRAAELDSAKLVLITNATGLDRLDVRRGLELIDQNNGEIWAKLDAGTEEYFQSVDRTSISFHRILKNIRDTARSRPIVIQSLFLKVYGQAMSPGELAAYCDRLKEITDAGGQIKEVHAYTVARRTTEACATKLTAEELDDVAETIRARTGLTVWSFD